MWWLYTILPVFEFVHYFFSTDSCLRSEALLKFEGYRCTDRQVFKYVAPIDIKRLTRSQILCDCVLAPKRNSYTKRYLLFFLFFQMQLYLQLQHLHYLHYYHTNIYSYNMRANYTTYTYTTYTRGTLLIHALLIHEVHYLYLHYLYMHYFTIRDDLRKYETTYNTILMLLRNNTNTAVQLLTNWYN